MNILAVIPARGGSKGVPRKNIKLLNGIPLIGYTIKAALSIFSKDNICVSTDSIEIKQVAESFGIDVPFIRPEKLSSDTATSQDVLLHALKYYKTLNREFDAIVLLQPTSPLRNTSQIKEAIELYSEDVDMIVSVCETKSNPYYVLFEENRDGYLIRSKQGKFTRRQDCPKVWEINGAIYVINVKKMQKMLISEFQNLIKYEMNERSSIDIDSHLDFKIAEEIIKNNQ